MFRHSIIGCIGLAVVCYLIGFMMNGIGEQISGTWNEGVVFDYEYLQYFSMYLTAFDDLNIQNLKDAKKMIEFIYFYLLAQQQVSDIGLP